MNQCSIPTSAVLIRPKDLQHCLPACSRLLSTCHCERFYRAARRFFVARLHDRPNLDRGENLQSVSNKERAVQAGGQRAPYDRAERGLRRQRAECAAPIAGEAACAERVRDRRMAEEQQ
jgi:hypothetical protein